MYARGKDIEPRSSLPKFENGVSVLQYEYGLGEYLHPKGSSPDVGITC